MSSTEDRKTVLVTGGAGFIGSHVVDALIDGGHRVLVVDDLSSGKRENVHEEAELHVVDVRYPEAFELAALEGVDVLIHHAAQMDVRRSTADPEFDAEVNILGTLNMLQAAVKGKVKQVIFASTGGAIYGEQEVFPAGEDHPQRPLSPYGVSKLAGERYLYYFHKEHGLDVTCLRYANVYGERQNPHGEAGVVAIFLSRLLSGDNCSINGDGLQTRDYIHVSDVVRANLAAIDQPGFRTYNVGTGTETSVVDLYQLLAKAVETDREPLHGPAMPGEQRRSSIDAGLIRRELDLAEPLDLEQGLQRTANGSKNRRMARLLVTGGAGFIGANFVYYWLHRHPHDRVVVLDSLTYAGNRASLASAEDQSTFRFVEGDIRDQDLVESVLDLESIDTIVHFAAESHVDRSISGPDLFLEVNVGGTHTLLKAARNVWLDRPGKETLPHRFHHVSTDEVYGSLGPDDPPFEEINAYAPNSPYAASKAAADHLIRAYHHTYGLQTTISNCSNNYGPYQFPEKLIPLCIVCLLEGKELPIYGDGLQIRDWLHVDDHCRGIDRILELGQMGETYNIGTHNEQTNIDLVHTLCHMVDQHFAEDPSLAKRYPLAPPAQGQTCVSRIAFVKDRPGHDRRYAIDATRITQELGFGSMVPFEAGLEQTLRWFLTNDSWWRAVMDESYREWIAEQYEGRELEGE